MAAWQYEIALIPQRAVVDKYGHVSSRVEASEIDSADWWERWQPPPGYERRLASLLDMGESWHPDLKMWGREEGDRVQVWTENGRVVGIQARVDARKSYSQFTERLAEFARQCDCLLITPEGRVMEPLADVLLEEVRRSDAREFAIDPRAYLKRIRTIGRDGPP